MSSLSKKLRTILSGAACIGLVAACSSNAPANKPVSEDIQNIGGENVYQWWNNPGDVAAALAVVGSSPLTANKSMSRTAAEVDGRAKMAAILEVKIQQLVENWAQDTGDLSNPNSMQSLINNEAMTRQLVDTTIRGARAVKYQSVDGEMFALVVLEDPATFLDNVVAEIDERALQDETYFKTEVRKADARARLDALVAEEKEAIAAKQSEIVGPPPSR